LEERTAGRGINERKIAADYGSEGKKLASVSISSRRF